jgi:hypothetical protein
MRVRAPLVVHGLTSGSSGVAAYAGYPAVAVCALSIGLLYVLVIAVVVMTALATKKRARREAALQVLNILVGSPKPADSPPKQGE